MLQVNYNVWFFVYFRAAFPNTNEFDQTAGRAVSCHNKLQRNIFQNKLKVSFYKKEDNTDNYKKRILPHQKL